MPISKVYRDFFNQGVFTFKELLQLYRRENSEKTLRNLVFQGLKRGELGTPKRGLYFVIPPAQTKGTYSPDPFLIAAKLSKNPVVAYHSALALHGAAYSDSNRIYFFTPTLTRGFEFRGIEYLPIQKKATWGTEFIEREGMSVKTTDRERTVIDCVDRPDYAGGLEELLKSLDLFPSLDLPKLETYLRKVNKKILFAKMGFLLERMKDRWKVPEEFLLRIEKHCGKGAYYFEAKKGEGKFVPRWHLIVPANLESLLQGV